MLPALATLALVACSGRPTGVPEKDLQWRTSLRGDEVRVVVFDRTGQYRINGVALVGPGGAVVPARELTRESQSGAGGGGLSVGGDYGPRSGGGVILGMGFPVGGDSSSLERRTAAVIPTPPGYRQNAAQWHIQVDMTLPGGGTSQTTIATPTP
jgi:hypothetical protein